MKSLTQRSYWLNRMLFWTALGMILGSALGCASLPNSIPTGLRNPIGRGDTSAESLIVIDEPADAGHADSSSILQTAQTSNSRQEVLPQTTPARYSFAELDGDRDVPPAWLQANTVSSSMNPIAQRAGNSAGNGQIGNGQIGNGQVIAADHATASNPSSQMTPVTSSFRGDGFAISTATSKTTDRTNDQSENTSTVIRGQSPQDPVSPMNGSAPLGSSGVQQTTYQYPEAPLGGPVGGPGAAPGMNLINPGNLQYPSPQLGSPNELYPLNQGMPPGGVGSFPMNYADIDVYVDETQTGRINFGGAYNSDNGLVGQIIVDERNFDLWRFPRSWQDIRNGTAWRGAGQGFRMELVPGNQVQRYLVSFTEPYLLNTAVSLSVSGYYFDRNYFDWQENRLGGRVALGYRLTQDLSLSVGVRGENVGISDPRVNTSPKLNEALGDTDLFLGQISLINDTRDHPFLPTEGHYLSLMYSQGFGEVDFPRGDIELRKYRLLYQRPDGSGRHTLSFGTRLGFSGSGTPVYENYFAGGFSTMRGFDFRGAGPMEGGVRVGGNFQWLNTLEYMFPLTADDMIKGVTFVDFGTVEDGVKIDWDTFRIAPGFGFRVHMPAAGFGAPLAFDFAFPINKADSDDRQIFSFYMGVGR